MSFDVTALAYAQFMGRYSKPLTAELLAVVEPRPGERVLDVGSGPGVVTAALVERLGESAVAAVDPSASFVAEVERRWPGVDVRQAAAEQLPFDDDTFDVTVAQLVVHFMSDPVAGLREMGRVTRSGGRIAASVWDHAGGGGPLSQFWRTVHELDPGAPGEGETLPGTRHGHLVELATTAGLVEPVEVSLSVAVTHPTFDDWWEPYLLGVGPAGAYVAGLDDRARAALKAGLEQALRPAPFEIRGTAWCVLARA